MLPSDKGIVQGKIGLSPSVVRIRRSDFSGRGVDHLVAGAVSLYSAFRTVPGGTLAARHRVGHEPPESADQVRLGARLDEVSRAGLARPKPLHRPDQSGGARLAGISEHVRDSLARQGWNIGKTVSQIVPVIVGEVTTAIEMAARLREQGIWAPCIRPPSVPPGNSLLRISLSSMHTDAMIEQLLDSLENLRRL